MKHVYTLLFAACVSLACDSSLDPDTACEMFADALATRASECGFDYQANYNAIEASLGGCEGFDELRDQPSFEESCLPWTDELTCEQIDDASLVLDPSCEGQFVRTS
ncbi:MAG: hypothetical protein ACPG77_04825 [Nannocystaceae bacterium]